MTYNFDEIIDRKNSNAMNTEGFREYIFHADSTMRFPYADDEFIRMWVADMEFATPQVIIDAIKTRLDRRIFGYTRVFDPEYYNTFVRWTEKRYQWHFEKEHLVTSNGVIPALYEMVGYICKPDEKVLFVTPSYAYFKYAADFNNRESICSNLINNDGYYTIDFDDFEAKASDEKTALCIFCNPHNPSGRVWTPEELKRVGDICIRHNLWIISDEIHCDLLRVGMVHTPLAKLFPNYDKLITCMAPSKTFNMAGFMMSNIIIPNSDLRSIWKERHYNFDNPLSIAATQAAYAYGADWLDQMRAYLDENFKITGEYLAEHLPKAKYRISEATYLAWVNVGNYLPDEKSLPLFFANKAGVLLEGGNMFVANSDGYIRLNLACPRSIVKEGLRRICEAINNRR
ncbi:MalY/PatB family protein [Sporomusa acidovorans]|uniref:cysteine-S-conjugate beta-lyase n=1 Tax=Sporomusa acidovorans (strain ATCC 49682 / DSM 3132 / Mol) TaxID=1123286 RepID=A0ABZ3J656_SPOA4|nr:PatB family C-S lyase [Sporomusa acidovorans]OZC18505.1 cystathionine beta-lyase PatB [Sporomusa acidovorans DSM 3132]SDE36828.1 cystathione beta-lyase [Sporomusa acidovorans]